MFRVLCFAFLLVVCVTGKTFVRKVREYKKVTIRGEPCAVGAEMIEAERGYNCSYISKGNDCVSSKGKYPNVMLMHGVTTLDHFPRTIPLGQTPLESCEDHKTPDGDCVFGDMYISKEMCVDWISQEEYDALPVLDV